MRFLVCYVDNRIVFSIGVSLGSLVHAFITLLHQSWLVATMGMGMVLDQVALVEVDNSVLYDNYART